MDMLRGPQILLLKEECKILVSVMVVLHNKKRAFFLQTDFSPTCAKKDIFLPTRVLSGIRLSAVRAKQITAYITQATTKVTKDIHEQRS